MVARLCYGGPLLSLRSLIPNSTLEALSDVRQASIFAPPSAKRQAPFSILFIFLLCIFTLRDPPSRLPASVYYYSYVFIHLSNKIIIVDRP